MTARKIVGTIHLWFGMTSGLVVCIIALTGCLYAFRDEIQSITEPWRFVESAAGHILPPSELIAIGEDVLPGKHVHAVMYGQSEDAAKVIFYHDVESYYLIVYVNPFSGEVLRISDEKKGFFPFILNGHFYLWLPPDIGQPLVAISTLVFLVMIITGLCLWWPKNKNGARQRFSVKWSARWKRRNYDLHNVLGFYVFAIAIIFSVTGLVWGFEWFRSAYFIGITGGKEWRDYHEPQSAVPVVADSLSPAVDRVWQLMVNAYPEAEWVEVHTPEDSLSCIAANANPGAGTYWQTDYRYFDANTLHEYEVEHMWGRLNDASPGEKLMRMNYDIHVGSVLGLPGKILVFLASLLIASLPVTGFLIWKGRRRKSN